jgi:hypothetical protein
LLGGDVGVEGSGVAKVTIPDLIHRVADELGCIVVSLEYGVFRLVLGLYKLVVAEWGRPFPRLLCTRLLAR